MTKEEIEQFLADFWVEINGGGVITYDQIVAMEKIKKKLDVVIEDNKVVE